MGGDATFGQRLRAERVAAGMTQRELASATGLARSTVHGIEQGRHGAGIDVARRLANALGLTPADLIIAADLFDVEFDVGALRRSTPPPWMERLMLAQVPKRPAVAVWPYEGDGVLRLRCRASSLPSIGALAGRRVDGISESLPAPTFRPVAPSRSLSVVLRAASEAEARASLDERLLAAQCSPLAKLEEWAGLWRVRLDRVPTRSSLVLQGIVPTSPIGLFVPACAA